MLGTLRHEWAPQAFVVSFKLETDEGILIQKVRCRLRKHAAHVWHEVLGAFVEAFAVLTRLASR